MISHFTQPHLGILCLSKSLGGLELNTIRFADWLNQRGWRLTLFLLPDSPIAEKAIQKNLPVSYTNKSFQYFDIWNASKLAKQIDSQNIEILLFTNNKDTSMVAWVKSFCKKLKVIYQQQMQIGVAKKDFLHTLRFGIIDAWISPLKWLANEVHEKTLYNPDKVHVIPLGTELEKFIENDYTRINARQELGLPADARIIGVLGRIDPSKGQEFLVKAVHHLNTELQEDIELLIMGEPTRNATEDYLPYLKQMAEDLGIAEKVHFRNFTEKPEIFYKAIDVFGMASVNETFGMVTIEAMASGVPVVAAASGSNPELLRKGGLGFLYQPGNLQEFAACIKQCFQNPKKMKRFGELTKREAQRKYSHTSQCQHTEQLIWQIL